MFQRFRLPTSTYILIFIFFSVVLVNLHPVEPVFAQNPPGFSQVFSPNTIGPGSVSTLIFTIDNAGSGTTVTDLAFSNTLPAGVAIATPANPSNSCTGGTLTAPNGGTTITYSAGSVGSNSSCTLTVDVTSSAVGTHTNTSGDLTSSAGNSGPATDDLTVNTNRPGFSKSFSPSTVPIGSRSTLTFVIDNSANASIVTFLSFTDNLPVGLEVANPANASTTCSGHTVTLTAAPGTSSISLSASGFPFGGFEVIVAGGTCTVVVDVIAANAGSLNNVTELTSGSGGPTVSSGKASATLNVTTTLVSLAKSFTADPVKAGDTTSLQFTLVNRDRSFSATDIAFSDDLEATLSGLVATGLPQSNVCGAGSTLSGTSMLSLTGGNLTADGGTCTFTVTLQIPSPVAAGIYPNTTSPVTANIDGTPVSGNAALDSLTVTDAPSLTKTFLSDPVGSGDMVTVAFTVTNTSVTTAATAITFSDNLGAFLSGVTPIGLPLTNFCGAGSSLTVVSISGQDHLQMSNGSLAASATCSFQVDLQLPTGLPAGTYTSTTEDIRATVNGTTQIGNGASDTLTVVGAPLLTKSFTDDPVLPGGTVALAFTLSHNVNAPANATAITFTDDLEATLSGLVATGLPLNDVCGGGSQISGTSNLTFSGGSLTPGNTCAFTVTLAVPATAPPGKYLNVSSNLSATVSGVAVTGHPAQNELEILGLTLEKSFLDDPVLPGNAVTLAFTLTNSHPTDAATNIAFTDNLSSMLSGLVSTSGTQADICGAGSQLTGTSNLTFTGGSLNAGESCAFTVTLLVPGGAADGAYNNVTSSVSADSGGSAVTLPAAIDTLTVNSTLLQLAQSFTDDPVSPGESVTLEFTLTNLEPTQSAINISFTDDLDAALSGLTATGLPLNNICGAGSQLSGTSLLSFTGGNLAGGASCTFSVTLTVPTHAGLGTTATNTTSGLTGNIGGIPVTGPAVAAELLLKFLTISKQFDTATIPNSFATLAFTITNILTDTAVSQIAFTDNLDEVVSGLVATGLPAADACGLGSQLSGSSQILLSNGSLAAGGSCAFTATVYTPPTASPGDYLNTTSDLFLAGLSAGEPATATLTVEPPPTFTKAFSPAIIGVGLTSTLVFTIDNSLNTLAATSLNFSDNLPAGVSVATPANAVTSCTGGAVTATPGTGLITYSSGMVAAGTRCNVSVSVTGSVAGSHVNTTGNLSSSHGLSTPANATLLVIAQPGFSKSFSPNPVAINDVSVLTFTIDNTSSDITTTGLNFSDTLPANLIIANPADAATTCTGGTLTAGAGTSIINYTGGTVAARGTCTIRVNVTSSLADSYLSVSGDLSSSLGNSGSATATLVVEPPLTFHKIFGPDVIPVQQTSTLTFTFDNSVNGLVASNLVFTDTLPTNVIIATPPNATNSCSGGILTAIAGGNTVTYSGGSVSAGAVCTIQVNVTSGITGIYLNTTSDLFSSLGVTPAATATLRVEAPPLFTMQVNPATLAVGETSRFTFTIDHSANTLLAANLTLTSTLPPGLIIANPNSVTTTCTGGTITASPGTNDIRYVNGSVSGNTSCQMVVEVEATSAGDFTVAASLASSFGSSGGVSASLRVNPQPLFSQQFGPATIYEGQISTLTFTIDNGGSTVDAPNLTFSNLLPTGLIVATPASDSTTCTGGTLSAPANATTITYGGGSVAAGGSCTIQVDVLGQLFGTHLNTTGNLTSSLGSSGTATATLVVNPAADLVLTKSVVPSVAEPNQAITYTLAYTNVGNEIATGVSITDLIPAGVISTSVSNSGTTITQTLTEYQWAVADLNPGQSGIITITGVLDDLIATTDIVNTATITGALDFKSANNTDSATIKRISLAYLPLITQDALFMPDLVIESLQAGSNQITLTIRNGGNMAVTDAFWVQVSINPATPLTDVNQQWNTLGNQFVEATQGAFWGVVSPAIPLNPGEIVMLTVTDHYYYLGEPANNIPDSIPTGSLIYAQVDAINFATTYGNIRELDETNNITQTISISGTGTVPSALNTNLIPFDKGRLPGLNQ